MVTVLGADVVVKDSQSYHSLSRGQQEPRSSQRREGCARVRQLGFWGHKEGAPPPKGVGSGRVFQRSVVQLGRTSTTLSKREGDRRLGP